MVPNGKIFDNSLEKGRPYDVRVGAGQVCVFSPSPIAFAPLELLAVAQTKTGCPYRNKQALLLACSPVPFRLHALMAFVLRHVHMVEPHTLQAKRFCYLLSFAGAPACLFVTYA